MTARVTALLMAALVSTTAAAQMREGLDAAGQAIELIRVDLMALARRGGVPFGLVLTTRELRQGRPVTKRAGPAVPAPIDGAAFAAHWGADFEVEVGPDIIYAVSKQTQRCATSITRAVKANKIGGNIFEVVHGLMVSEGLATNAVPASTWGSATRSSEAARSATMSVDIPSGMTMLQALNQIVLAAAAPVGWVVIERRYGEPDQCQLALMLEDAVVWTAYDIDKSTQ